jgi:Na+/H+-dicarboxylate symporter
LKNTIVNAFGRYSRLSFGTKMLIWIAAGVLAGLLLGKQAMIVQPVGDLFVKLLLMAAIPLVFLNLIAGITSLENVRVLGRYGVRTVVYYFVTTAFAMLIALVTVHLFQPGEGMNLTKEVDESFGKVPSVIETIQNLFPSNAFHAFSSGNVGQVVVFAIFLGITTLTLPQAQKEKLQSAFALGALLFRQLVVLVLNFAPIGVAALAASTVGEYGGTIFGPLAKFLGSVWTAHLMMITFYMLVLVVVTRRSPLEWLKTTAPLYATTAATCSSLASLTVAMDIAEKKLKLPEKIYSFTLPLGAQLNKDGTSIMLVTVLLFTAQAAGVEFSIPEQITIVLIGLVLTEGSGGIAGGGMVIAFIFVEAFNLPLEVAGIIAGIYRLTDMGNSTVNCMGDLVWTTVLSDLEEKRDAKMKAPPLDA